MPIELKGLPGLNTLSDAERQAFMLNNEEKLRAFSRNPRSRDRAAEILYNNQRFISKFGQEEFDRLNDGSEESYNRRNQLLEESVVNEAIDKKYKPREVNGKLDLNTGAGKDWERIQQLDTEAKKALYESDWKTPEQMKKEQEDRDSWYEKAIDFVAGEAIQQYKKESNQKILDRVFNDAADSASSKQAPLISQAYAMPEVIGSSDEDTVQKFAEAIVPSEFNRGIPEYASHWRNGGKNVSEEMKNFSIDDMRQVLAKKYVYERTMSPELAYTALNNEAQRYIKDHQGSMRRLELFAKDVGISAMSYTADKINGIYNTMLAAEDWLGNKPEVFVDESGNVVDPKKNKVLQDNRGNLFYEDKDGVQHIVHRENIDRRTLHNMGREEDGSESEEGMFHLNPIYWTRAEQFGELDADKQKQWEKLGSSPHKVVYDPNDDRDLVYESFKMMSFGIADAASMLIPFGIGAGGRVLSTASNVGKVGRGLGKALDTVGKYTSAQSKIGQIGQGIAGAGGIAYAYQRGAFQETLAKNLANAEEANLERSKRELFEQYNNNAQYKAQVDSMVAQRAAEMKQEYLAQALKEGTINAIDGPALDAQIQAQASDLVHRELLNQKVQENKNSAEYAALQQEAIQSAGDAAWTTFWPEAIKYGMVNTMGYRKFLYTNPTGLKKPISRAMKGMKEMTTKEGRQRLAVEAANGSNLKKLGKVVGSQFWGGAWTNGTDDMMVDAAERINEDSFNRYLTAYENGEALADEYQLLDGIYSYWKGLNNSLGQESTYEATAVGGFGSLVSASPNMANIAHLATKEGREAFRNNFQKRLVYETDENGFKSIKKDENGKPVTEDVSWKDNWRERAAFFIQNGVLNTYYGAKQNERDLQSHADYVNSILDSQDDFNALKDLIASDIERQNVEEPKIGDAKTQRFTHAFNSINALEQLSKSKNDAFKFSSVLDNAKSLMENASKIGTDENTLSDEQLSGLIAEYYSHNPGVAESDENHQIALSHIAQNAKKMMEAYDAYNKAIEHVSNYERDKGITIVPAVKNKLILHKALTGHWKDRIETMQQEIGDSSTLSARPIGESLIAAVGGKNRAKAIVNDYKKAEGVLKEKALNPAIAFVQKKLEAYNKAQEALRNAETSEDKYAAEQALYSARLEYEAALATRDMAETEIENFRNRRTVFENAIEEAENSNTKEAKILTADEIMALDPMTRADMLDPKNRYRYTNDQKKEIAELEKRLLQRDTNGDPLQKIQDIAMLTMNIRRSEDAYNRLSQNPDAAALELERQTVKEAEKAYNIINERNAKTLANSVQDVADALKLSKVKKADRDAVAYRMLRKHSNTLLDIIDRQQLLPGYQTQIDKAKEWSKVLTDIDAVVNNMEGEADWKRDLGRNIDKVIDVANSRDEIIAKLEEVIDTPSAEAPNAAQDFEKILGGLAQLGYTRDTTVLENRKQRLEREEKARLERERQQKEADEAAKKAAEEAAAKKAAENASRKSQVDTSKVTSPDMGTDNLKSMGEGLDLGIDFGPEEKEEEKAEEAPAASLVPSMLMDEESEDGVLNVGDMWTNEDTPQVGMFTVKRQKVGKAPVLTFTIDDKPTTFEVTPDEYVMTQEAKEKLNPEADAENLPFNVKSLEKIEGKWYFEGNFAGQSENTTVRVNDKFDLDKAIERERLKREDAAISSGVDMHDPNIIDDGEQISGQSESIEQQAEPGVTLMDVDNTDEAEELNEQGTQAAETTPLYLGANAMLEHDSDDLKKYILTHRYGVKPNDSRNHFFAWLEEKGIKYSNIVNTEVPLILQKNPQTKIRFMAVRPEVMGTKVGETTVNGDNNISKYVFLVVDYNKDIQDIHNDANGGVITAAGKKYLIVGTVGYGRVDKEDAAKRAVNLAKRDYYNIIKEYDGGKLHSNKYYAEHPEEQYRVLEDVYTEFVPGSIIPGYIIKQIENVKSSPDTPVSEILKADNEREGTSYTLEDLKWGIQQRSKFLPIKESNDNILHPRRVEDNAGAAFVLVPSGRGKYVPVHLSARKYSELRGNEDETGTLKNRIKTLLGRNHLLAPGKGNYVVRKKAVDDLRKIFYLSKDGNNILIGKNDTGYENKITLVNGDGDILFSKYLDAEFDEKAFLDAFEHKLNPRINITASSLLNTGMLIALDEAGALDTDVLMLHTAGVTYSIYPIDRTGKIIKPESVNNAATAGTNVSDFRSERNVVWYGGLAYEYKPASKSYTYGVETVTEESNPDTFKALEFNRSIILGKLTPNYHSDSYQYFVMRDGEHPLVVKADVHHRLTELSEEQSQKIIDTIKEEAEKKKRAEEAQKELDKLFEDMTDEKQEAPAETSEEGSFVIDPNNGMVVLGTPAPEEAQGTQQDSQKKEEKGVSEQTPEVKDPVSEGKKPEDAAKPKEKAETQSFEALIKKKKYKTEIYSRLAKKWPQLGIDIDRAIVPSTEKLREFLEGKGMILDGIGTTETDIRAWIDTIEKCRD